MSDEKQYDGQGGIGEAYANMREQERKERAQQWMDPFNQRGLAGVAIGGAMRSLPPKPPKPLSVIEELRMRRVAAGAKLQRLAQETADTEIEYEQCGRALDALIAPEAPAQPLDELRTDPGSVEEVRDQFEASTSALSSDSMMGATDALTLPGGVEEKPGTILEMERAL